MMNKRKIEELIIYFFLCCAFLSYRSNFISIN